MNNVERVLDAMAKEHKKHRLSPVTKKRLHMRTKKFFCYRTLERILRALVNKGKVENKKRGKYWLPQYYKIHLLIAEPYAEHMKYCQSKEDWALWVAFRNKMILNKEKEQQEEQREAEQAGREWEHEQWLKRDAEADKKMAEKADLNCAIKLAEKIKHDQKL